jgi:hypothetical protein
MVVKSLDSEDCPDRLHFALRLSAKCIVLLRLMVVTNITNPVTVVNYSRKTLIRL